jgi:hypothetical protein
MISLEIRKFVAQIEETLSDFGQPVSPPCRRATVAAVIANPYAGKYVEDLSPLYEIAGQIAVILTERAIAALGVSAESIESYGKGAVVGTNGEIEHASALIHPKFGAPVRAIVQGKDIMPSTKKVGPPGMPVTIPLSSKQSIWEFDHMDTTEIAIPDAPRADEVVIAVTFAIGGRPLHRIKPPAN